MPTESDFRVVTTIESHSETTLFVIVAYEFPVGRPLEFDASVSRHVWEGAHPALLGHLFTCDPEFRAAVEAADRDGRAVVLNGDTIPGESVREALDAFVGEVYELTGPIDPTKAAEVLRRLCLAYDAAEGGGSVDAGEIGEILSASIDLFPGLHDRVENSGDPSMIRISTTGAPGILADPVSQTAMLLAREALDAESRSGFQWERVDAAWEAAKGARSWGETSTPSP